MIAVTVENPLGFRPDAAAAKGQFPIPDTP
jgi:hypothetical protein